MELVYYTLTFVNQKEYIIVMELKQEEATVKTIQFYDDSLSLQKIDSDSEPVNFMPGTLFTYQKTNKEMVGAQSKVWKVV